MPSKENLSQMNDAKGFPTNEQLTKNPNLGGIVPRPQPRPCARPMPQPCNCGPIRPPLPCKGNTKG